jgi:hypothetical protein
MSDFNWVQARAACSLPKVFKLLEIGVRRDVDVANAIAKEGGEPTTFSVKVQGNYCVVMREHVEGFESVEFLLEQDRVSVKEKNETKFFGTPSLNADGECRLFVGNAELELWQFCKRALESLFF